MRKLSAPQRRKLLAELDQAEKDYAYFANAYRKYLGYRSSNLKSMQAARARITTIETRLYGPVRLDPPAGLAEGGEKGLTIR